MIESVLAFALLWFAQDVVISTVAVYVLQALIVLGIPTVIVWFLVQSYLQARRAR